MRIGITEEAGHSVATLARGEDEAVVSSFGGQILSWTKSGVPIIFSNRERALVDGHTPYRGGAPICFPYFGMGTLLPLGTTLTPQHGGARSMVWEQTEEEAGLLMTTVQPAGTGYGPTSFSCELRVTLGEALQLSATIRNVGAVEAPFQFAVHTYWKTDFPEKAQITGLGNRYLDNLMALSEQSEPDSSIPHPTPVDRVYLDAWSEQTLLTEHYRLEVATAGCAGAVLWNPGLNHTIKDLGTPTFICLESGQIAPSKSLAPGEMHQIDITYRVVLS